MNKQGLLVGPKFYDPNNYLQSGSRTKITEEIKEKSSSIPNGWTDGQTIRNIMLWIQKNIKIEANGSDPRKFNRTAEEILESRESNGCCDNATLFAALARAKGIPTMMIITFDKDWAMKINNGEKDIDTKGHFFTACYLRDNKGKYDWVLIDPSRDINGDKRNVKLSQLNRVDRNIGEYYAFAYVVDYYDDLGIDSIESMSKIQVLACEGCGGEYICYDKGEDFIRS